jgi:excisionase family DNA binding protein
VAKQWLSLSEAADELGVSRATLYRWQREGRLPLYELESGGGRRIKRNDLDALLRPVGAAGEALCDGRAVSATLVRRFPREKLVEVAFVGRISFEPGRQMPPRFEHRIIPESDFKALASVKAADPRLPDVVEEALKASEEKGHDMEMADPGGPAYAWYRCRVCGRQVVIQPIGNRLGRTVQDAIHNACK